MAKSMGLSFKEFRELYGSDESEASSSPTPAPPPDPLPGLNPRCRRDPQGGGKLVQGILV
jgi:hypothetical protein